MLVTLLRYVFDGAAGVFDRVGGPMLGLFPFITMFLVTSITMLRERTTGTLERLMTMPLAKLDLLLGYGDRLRARRGGPGDRRLAASRFGLLGLHVAGLGASLVVALAVGNAVLGMALGLFVERVRADGVPGGAVHAGVRLPAAPALRASSSRATQMAGWLRAISDAFPLTYAYDALVARDAGRGLGAWFAFDLVVTIGATLLALALGAATLRRRTA